jgi:MFS family permease
VTVAAPARRGLAERPVAFGLLMGALCAPVALGISTAPVALASVSGALALSRAQAAWILIGYALTQAMAVPLCGRLGDARGLRGLMAWAPVLLVVGTLAASASSGFGVVLAGRLAQGAAGGALTVAAISLVAARIAPLRRPHALGTMTAVIGLISGAGTWIGGTLTDATSWRVTFALPALAIVAAVVARPLAPPDHAVRGSVDLRGAALVAAAAGLGLVLLESPSTHPPTGMLVVLGVTELVILVLLRRSVRTRPLGFLPRALVENRGFVLAALSALTVCSGYIAVLFAVPELLAGRHAWTPGQVGTALLPAAAAGAISAHVVGRLTAVVDGFRVAAVLALASAAGVLVAAAGDGAVLPSVLGLALVLGAQTGTNVAVLSRLPVMVHLRMRSLAAGMFTLLFQIGGPIGTALVTGLSGPLGTGGALAAIAVLPAAGVLLVLRSREEARQVARA